MQRGVWRWAVSACLAGLILGLGSVFAERAAAEEGGLQLPNAACNDLDLRVGASVGEQTCRAASLSNVDARARAEIVNALGAGTIFMAEYINAGMHTYIHRSTPREIAEKTGLEKARGEEEARFQMHGFDVWRFKATAGMHCASFAKHWSRVSRTPGYRHRIIGVYCSQRESDVADARLDQVFASIEPTE